MREKSKKRQKRQLNKPNWKLIKRGKKKKRKLLKNWQSNSNQSQ
jgi:hypothetical protein